jgi:DNA (cytosine-5)-methyltransferase 1
VNVYFNDNEPFVTQWLRNLWPEATVDGRSITDVTPEDVASFDRVHLFAGIGGWEYALDLAEWGDTPVWTASLPCQPFSTAGMRRGADDERHLWPVTRDLIEQCRPTAVFGEQVASRAGREWLAGVRTDLEALGYAVGAADLCAASCGAAHIRQRLYWVAYSQLPRLEGCAGQGQFQSWWSSFKLAPFSGRTRRFSPEPESFPLAHGIPARVGRIRAYGGSIVPPLAATFIRAAREAGVA